MKHTSIFLVFLTSIFLSAFLLFMVQPMAGKLMLPLVGGSPSGWIVSLAFFQISLLVGYIVAHWFGKLPAKTHGLSVVALLALGAVFLPLGFDEGLKISNSSKVAYNVFLLLTTAVFVPFVALSSVSSTIQRLFHNTAHSKGEDPYFLYAVSNFGSFIGLLGYPFLIEPYLTVTMQTEYWMYLYAILSVLILIASFQVVAKAEAEDGTTDIKSPNALTCLTWVGLAFVPSSLMVGVTNFITFEVSSIPLFWVLPLSLYLLTYIFAFSSKGARIKKRNDALFLSAAASIVLLYVLLATILSIWTLALHIMAFTVIALAFHTRLSDIKPHPKYLTAFYLYLAIGGALGGVFNAFVAPLMFDKTYEYPLVAVLAVVIYKGFDNSFGSPHRRRILMGLGLIIVACIVMQIFNYFDTPLSTSNIVWLMFIPLVMIIASHMRSALYLSIFLLIVHAFVNNTMNNSLYQGRNFFGPIQVTENTVIYKGLDYTLRKITHGTTVHGLQLVGLEAKNMGEFSYYAPLSPIFKNSPIPSNVVGIIGLGAGTLLCYTKPDRHFITFEIDSEVVAVAKKYFNFIEGCGHPKNEIILGDGRLEFLKRPESFDTVVIDAFSSDAIPAHLLTLEALTSYKQKLQKDGAIFINISNRYYDLAPVISKTAERAGFTVLLQDDKVSSALPPWRYNSKWIALIQDTDHKNWLLKNEWVTTSYTDETPLWTDDYTYLLSSFYILKDSE